MHRSNAPLSLLVLLVVLFSTTVVPGALATIISTFTDHSCQDSYKSLNGPNGYPNGTCTLLNESGPFGSFQLVQADAGCAVTLYGNDTVAGSPCSATVLDIAQIATCYNSSWVYFSIDECTAPAPSSSSGPSISTPTTTTTTTTPTSAAVSSPAAASAASSGIDTGAIVGGVVGGVAGVALLGAIAWFLLLRRSNRNHRRGAAPGPDPNKSSFPPPQFPSAVPMHELSAQGGATKHELYDDSRFQPARIPPNSTHGYAELPGTV